LRSVVQKMAQKLGVAQKAAFGGWLLVHAKATRSINSQLELEGLIPFELYDVLLALEEAPEHRLRMSELADAVVFSPSGLTRLVDRLERMGFVQREPHPTDKRSFHAVITEQGLQARSDAWPRYSELIQEHFGAYLTLAEARTVVGVAKKVLGRETWPGCGE